MNKKRIWGIILQELYITKHSLEVIFDLFYFSIVTIIIFGFFATYLTGAQHSQAAHFLLLGMILWEIIRVTQYSVSVGILWNIWSSNLSNMFIAPLTLTDYLIATIIAGAIKAIFIFLAIATLSIFIFQFNIFQLGFLNLLLYFINLTIFAWSLGIILMALIFYFGMRIQALAWGLVTLFQPLTAAFFPVDILPTFLQSFAYMLPPTYVFEAARNSYLTNTIEWNHMILSFAINILYFILSLWIFKILYLKSKQTGQFAKNES